MTDAPRWYVQLRLLTDGRGEISIGWYLFDPQHVEPRRLAALAGGKNGARGAFG
jgi:hypothetical protein